MTQTLQIDVARELQERARNTIVASTSCVVPAGVVVRSIIVSVGESKRGSAIRRLNGIDETSSTAVEEVAAG